jgi:hypothetical protein
MCLAYERNGLFCLQWTSALAVRSLQYCPCSVPLRANRSGWHQSQMDVRMVPVPLCSSARCWQAYVCIALPRWCALGALLMMLPMMLP